MLAAQESFKKAQEEKKKEAMKLINDLRTRKQNMMREQLEQQKKLIAKLEAGKGVMKQEERDKLMDLMKSLQESIETLKKDLEENSKLQHPSLRLKEDPFPKEAKVSHEMSYNSEINVHLHKHTSLTINNVKKCVR